MKKLILIVIIIFAAMILAEEAKTYKVIVNESNPINSITKKELAKIFFKKLTKWDSGSAILLVDQDESSPVREIFCKDVLKKSVAKTKVFWQEQIFSGRGVPPIEKASDKEVIDYVKSNPGAIGYISVNATIPSSGIKVIEVKEQIKVI